MEVPLSYTALPKTVRPLYGPIEFTHPFRIYLPLQNLTTPSGFSHTPSEFTHPFRIYPPTSESACHLHNLPTSSGFTRPLRIYQPLENLPTPSGFTLHLLFSQRGSIQKMRFLNPSIFSQLCTLPEYQFAQWYPQEAHHKGKIEPYKAVYKIRDLVLVIGT